jgi:hypothetical protein
MDELIWMALVAIEHTEAEKASQRPSSATLRFLAASTRFEDLISPALQNASE